MGRSETEWNGEQPSGTECDGMQRSGTECDGVELPKLRKITKELFFFRYFVGGHCLAECNEVHRFSLC